MPTFGFPIGGEQKPWSELTDSEKKTRIASYITFGVVVVVAIVVARLLP